jgi:hypothetical protein
MKLMVIFQSNVSAILSIVNNLFGSFLCECTHYQSILAYACGQHFVELDFEDAWGNTWRQADVVIWGYWYDVL